MREPKPVQQSAAFRMFRNRNHRAPVLVCKPERVLDCAHYSDTSQVRLQLRLKIGEKFPVALLSHHTDDADALAIHVRNHSAHRTLDRAAVINLEIELRGLPGYYLWRRLLRLSTDSITARHASNVQGLGAAACRHILESVSQSPPKAKSSS